MFGLFKKRPSPDREGLRSDFAKIISGLSSAEPLARVAVGAGINKANSTFLARFGSVAAFQAIDRKEQLQYLEAIKTFHAKFHEQDPHVALGFILFGMWVATLVEKDDELRKEFARGLELLSKEGDLPL